MKKIVLSLLIFYLLISTSVYAQVQVPVEWKWLADGANLLFGIPAEWMDTPGEFIGNVLVPFIAIFAIFLGFLRQLHIFEGESKIQMVIALGVAFVTGITRLFVYLVGIILSALGFWSVLLFAFMFILGSVLYSWGYYRRGRAGVKIIRAYETSIDKLKAEHEKLGSELANAIKTGDIEKADKLKDRLQQNEKKMEEIKAAMKY